MPGTGYPLRGNQAVRDLRDSGKEEQAINTLDKRTLGHLQKIEKLFQKIQYEVRVINALNPALLYENAVTREGWSWDQHFTALPWLVPEMENKIKECLRRS